MIIQDGTDRPAGMVLLAALQKHAIAARQTLSDGAIIPDYNSQYLEVRIPKNFSIKQGFSKQSPKVFVEICSITDKRPQRKKNA